jgi:hypothetical protein
MRSMAAWLIVLGCSVSAPAGPVTFRFAPSRVVSASATVAEAPPGESLVDFDEERFPGEGTFDTTVSAALLYPEPFESASVNGSIETFISPTRFQLDAVAHMEAKNLSGLASFYAETLVAFTVTEPQRYELFMSSVYPSDPHVEQLATALLDTEDVGFLNDVFSEDTQHKGVGPPISRSGTIGPGDYTLHLYTLFSARDGDGPMTSSATISVTFSDAATPIPLPPAAWGGIATMAAVIASRSKLLPRARRTR